MVDDPNASDLELVRRIKQGDDEAAKRFQAIQAAYEVLKSAEERRTGAKV